jgi:hypothetical protein
MNESDFVILRREVYTKHGTIALVHLLITRDGFAFRWNRTSNRWDPKTKIKMGERTTFDFPALHENHLCEGCIQTIQKTPLPPGIAR